jgi:hypothetical protein
MSDPNTNNINTTNTVDNQYNEQFIKQLETYRNMVMSFINTNKADLLKIYMQHRNTANDDNDDQDKLAVLGIQLVMSDKPSIDIAYLPIHILETEIQKKLHERIEINNDNIIYFLMITPCEEQILEIDARDLL